MPLTYDMQSALSSRLSGVNTKTERSDISHFEDIIDVLNFYDLDQLEP